VVEGHDPDDTQEHHMSSESKFDEGKGRAKEAAGAATGDEDLKREGKTDQAAASVKDKMDKVGDKANDMVDKAKDAANRDNK
jgi:uncharacterized protein YjbJ (UPF0337 family)